MHNRVHHHLVEGRAAEQAARATVAGDGGGGEASLALVDHFVHRLDARADTPDRLDHLGVDRLDQTSHEVADVGVLAQVLHLAVGTVDSTLDFIDATFGHIYHQVEDPGLNLVLDTGQVAHGVGLLGGKRGHGCKGL